MKKYKKIVFFATVVILLTAVGCFWMNHHQVSMAAKPKETLSVNVVPLEKENVDIITEFIGYVTPIQTVDIKPNVSGYVDEIFVQGGQQVSSGDRLVLIDQLQYEAQLEAAQAAQAKALADFNNAKVYYNRMKKAGKNAVSATALDQAKAQFLTSEASLMQAKAETLKAQTLYNYTILQAPINGIVGNINLTKGNYVAPDSNPLFSIVQFDPIRVEFAISDKDYLSYLKHNSSENIFRDEKIEIRLSDQTLYEKKGKFQFVDNHLNKDTNSVSVFVDFENTDKKLLANSYVTILISKKLKDVFLIRQNYVTLNDKGAFVYLLKEGKMRRVPLKITDYYQDFYVVENKFNKDDFLVIDKIGDISPEVVLSMKIVSDGEK